MSDNYSIDTVELDLPISSSEIIEDAKNFFKTDQVRIKGKYAAEPVTFIALLSSITTNDVTKELVLGAVSGTFFYGVKKIITFLKTPNIKSYEKAILVNHTMKAVGILWEIRYDPSLEITPYLKGLIINSVDINNLPPDAFRVSINLVNGYAKVFDEQKQFICDLPFENPL